ncbi:MAG: hypothetical protein ACWGQW_17795, partial [bacterium]
LKSATDEAQTKIDEIVKTLHVSPEALAGIQATWTEVENVFTHLASTIKSAGIGSLISTFRSIDPTELTRGFAKLSANAATNQGLTGQILDNTPIQQEADKHPVVIPVETADPDPNVIRQSVEGFNKEVEKQAKNTGGAKIPVQLTTKGLPAELQGKSNQAIPPAEINKIAKQFEKPT